MLCDGVELNSYIGSLKALAVKIFMQDAIRHTFTACPLVLNNASTASRHFALARAMHAFSNIFNLNMIQCVASGYSIMLHGDIFSTASSLAFNGLSFGVNMLAIAR